MNLQQVFRLSTYICLAMATFCLAYTDPVTPIGFYLAVWVLLVVAFLVHDRWAMPSHVANLLAVVIFLVWLFWFYAGIRNPALQDLSPDLFRAMLPRIGPLLCILLLAKLFRPKLASDYWLLHGLGLVQVALSCVLALSNRVDREEPGFPLLLLGYTLSGVWSMMSFLLHREAGAGNAESRQVSAASPPIRMPGWSGGLLQAACWFALALGLALLLFLAVPRPNHEDASAWMAGPRTQAQVGFNAMIDLKDTTPLETSDEIVMWVDAFDSEGKPIMLDADQRFRGATLSRYRDGQWQLANLDEPRALPARQRSPDMKAPQLAELVYNIDLSMLGGANLGIGDHRGEPSEILPSVRPLFLAEPIYGPRFPPRVWPDPDQPSTSQLYFRRWEPALYGTGGPRTQRLVYRHTHYLPEPDVAAPQSPMRLDQVELRTIPGYRFYRDGGGFPSERRGEIDPGWRSERERLIYSIGRLQRLPEPASSYQFLRDKADEILAKADLSRADTVQELAELKARTLERYLAGSGEYRYTLKRDRKDESIDPNVDFLKNVKEGHCSRFASALALMLRSQRIPARVVVGFRGCEWNGYLKSHAVRQCHAHAWVEAFIGVPERPSYWHEPLVVEGYWLPLDPTPPGGPEDLDSDRSAWADEAGAARYFWEFYVLDYTGKLQRNQLASTLKNSVDQWLPDRNFVDTLLSPRKWTWQGIVATLVGAALIVVPSWLLLRRRRDRAPRSAPVLTRVSFYARLLELLARVPLRPGRAQTPEEFIAEASGVLHTRLAPLQLSETLQNLVRAFYEVRFGDRVLDRPQSDEIQHDLNRLERALQKPS